MPVHKKIQEMIEQTRNAQLPPIKDQSLQQMRFAFSKLRALQGESRALPKVEGIFITVGEELPLRLYYPYMQKRLPVIFYFHPGGYVKGDLESCDTICRELAFQTEALVISVGYRLSPEHVFPTPIQDGERAYNWVLANFRSLFADIDNIALCGDSSGGNLAAVLCQMLKGREYSPKAEVLIYPQLDYTMSLPSHKEFSQGYLLEEESLLWYRSQYVPQEHNLKDPKLSPLFASDFAHLPQTLILTAEYDPLRDEGELYAKQLQKDGVDVSLHRYEGMTHGFFQMAGVLEEGRLAMQEVAKFIKGSFNR